MGPIRYVVIAAALWTIPSFADPTVQSFPDMTVRQYKVCPKNGPTRTHISAIDTSQQINNAFVDQAVAQHIQVIFRYYDWKSSPNDSISQDAENKRCRHGLTKFNGQFDYPWKSGETISGKTLTPPERNLILSKGLSIGIVFQHCSDLIETFKDTKRAAFDAQQALNLAKDLDQPPKTVIFFGVDLDVINKDQLALVQSYMAVVKEKVEEAHYVLGVYGNGFICSHIGVKYCWLSQSTTYAGSKEYADSNSWAILQCAQRDSFPHGGPQFDLNIIKERKPPIPFWTARAK